MSLVDLSFNNTQIKAYFNGSDSYTPVSELMYIHSHPLVKPNFLDQLEAMILATSELIKAKNIRGSIIDRLTEHAMKFGAELPNINSDNAPKILGHLREVYKICNGLLINNNVMNS
jgi:hypothetical protein